VRWDPLATTSGRTTSSLLSAPLLTLAQPPWDQGVLGLVALIPWLLATRRSSGLLEAGASATLVAGVHGTLVGHWGFAALVDLGASHAAALIGLLATALWAKFPVFAPAAAIVFATRAAPDRRTLLVVAATFGALEAGQTWTRIGIPWAFIGHSQADISGVAQLATVGEVPLVSALLVAINFSSALVLERSTPERRRRALALLGVWTMLALGGLPLARRLAETPSTLPDRHLLLVQPDFPRPERWVPDLQLLHLERISRQTRQALNHIEGRIEGHIDGHVEGDASVYARVHVDAIVWPENTLTPVPGHDAELQAALQGEVDRFRVPLITGLAQSLSPHDPDRYRNSVVWRAPDLGVLDATHKQRAVPIIEAPPRTSGERWLARWLGIAGAGPRVQESDRASDLTGSFTVTPVICWEVLFPRLIEERRTPRSRVILNLADDSWIPGEAARHQLIAYARFRAIERRLPLVRLAHGGLSVVVDRYGQITQRLAPDRYAVGIVAIPESIPATIGTRSALLGLGLSGAIGASLLSGLARWGVAQCRKRRERRSLPTPR
jgi:apolipoprotein N-acyltransferase